MSAILKFDFQKRKQLRFSEVNYLFYTKKDPILHVTTTFSLKQGETRTNSVPFPHPLSENLNSVPILKQPYFPNSFPDFLVCSTNCTYIFKVTRIINQSGSIG